MKVPFKARTQAEPPAPQGESTTWASVGQAVSPATDFHHRLLAAGTEREDHVDGGENFDRDAGKLRAGLALVRGNPTWARYLAPVAGAAEGVALPASLSPVAL